VGSLKNTIVQKLFLGRSIKLADKIIAISEATKADIIEFYKVDENKISVIYNGTNIEKVQDLSEEEEKRIKEKFKIENEPFVFFISTIEPRKNVPTLIKAFNYIKDKEDTDLKLILAGGLGWKYSDVLELYDASKYKDDIIMPGYISKQEKRYLFENTKCFVYPSLYEGFGLPILEAMANNALVVTANNSSLPEVGGNVALYFDNILDEKELGEKITEAMNLSEEEKTKRIEQGLAQVKKFTWDDCANKTIAILEE
ncbi:MAG: glycosyltransferase family 4 protein, partial [Clostridia bacterium]|nr:glycosyltransferase family 4 protein [Clostridia bacterium]